MNSSIFRNKLIYLIGRLRAAIRRIIESYLWCDETRNRRFCCLGKRRLFLPIRVNTVCASDPLRSSAGNVRHAISLPVVTKLYFGWQTGQVAGAKSLNLTSCELQKPGYLWVWVASSDLLGEMMAWYENKRLANIAPLELAKTQPVPKKDLNHNFEPSIGRRSDSICFFLMIGQSCIHGFTERHLFWSQKKITRSCFSSIFSEESCC